MNNETVSFINQLVQIQIQKTLTDSLIKKYPNTPYIKEIKDLIDKSYRSICDILDDPPKEEESKDIEKLFDEKE